MLNLILIPNSTTSKFGCCTVRDQNQVEHTILIGSDCSLDQINDQTSCPRCEKSTQCDNPCGTCELCLGKQPEDLPDECRSQTTPSDNQDPDRSEMVPAPFLIDRDLDYQTEWFVNDIHREGLQVASQGKVHMCHMDYRIVLTFHIEGNLFDR